MKACQAHQVWMLATTETTHESAVGVCLGCSCHGAQNARCNPLGDSSTQQASTHISLPNHPSNPPWNGPLP